MFSLKLFYGKFKKLIITFIIFIGLSIIFLPYAYNHTYNSYTRNSNLTVSAPVSLTNVMEEIKILYEDEKDSNLDINYGSSGSLHQQIKQDAPADVFISAAQHYVDVLQEKGLIINESRQDLLENSIVLIIPATRENNTINGYDELSKESVSTMAIGDPESVPGGKYAMESLKQMGLWGELEDKLIFTKNVRQVLTYVELSNVDAGIVFKTDALTSDQVIIVEKVEKELHSPIRYPVAILASANNLNEAEQFLSFLQSEAVEDIFVKHGFTYILDK